MNQESNSSGGIGIVGILTIVFVVLKLVGVIDWSWWWVLSPLWISAALGVVVFLILLVTLKAIGRRTRR
ncbi:hypothetical protein Z045_05880 [Rhodococcus pyridinivorans KG-16]|uniref:Transmembrane Fragile-X-F protein n=1 Tax=Rhodococcus pyridinivorans KG-16 TaxID=1441730 RepID=A0A0V9UNX8_9NOCA|nr:hypothetical protein [Rhodococcus pyridinivorans]KSZ59695.1 hypothetical protein Z045_05880 [Rhodococcus pyridinivorans KG-16]